MFLIIRQTLSSARSIVGNAVDCGGVFRITTADDFCLATSLNDVKAWANARGLSVVRFDQTNN